MILLLLSYVGTIAAFVCSTLAIASGLYYLSEQVEEHTVVSKRILSQLIYGIIVVHVLLLLFDGFPFWLTVFSISAQVLYLQTLKKFPFIQVTDGQFLGSCVMVFLSHWLWFRYFSDPDLPPAGILIERPDYAGRTHPPFAQIASFFGICVWMIPFSLFIGLSAGDNVLPTSNELDDDNTGSQKARRRSVGLVKVLVEKMWFYIGLAGRQLGYDWDFGPQESLG
jgi:hypothetical protein